MSLVVMNYEHRHNCPREGQLVSVRRAVKDGAAMVARPQCIEPGPNQWSELTLVSTNVGGVVRDASQAPQ